MWKDFGQRGRGMAQESVSGMIKFLHSFPLLLIVAAGPALAQTPPPPATNTATAKAAIAITGVNVIDVEHGRALGPRTVIVEAGRIVAIALPSEAVIPAGAVRVNGRGKFLIPGLVDMHVHLFNLSSRRPPNDWAFPLFVANGVTAVRDMRADAPSIQQIRQWRRELERGALVAPRILAAGIVAHGNSPSDATLQVNAAADAGADFIKVFSGVPEANWRAIVAAASARSLPVAGHVPAGVSLATAASAGQRSSEHLLQAYEACSVSEAKWLSTRRDRQGVALEAKRDAQEAHVLGAFDTDACRRTAKALAAAGQQVQVPTLVLANADDLARSGSAAVDPRWRYLRADERDRWKRALAAYTTEDAALAELRWPVARQIVATMHAAGVAILAGTDTPMPGVYPGYSLHEEMALLVSAGMPTHEVLKAATFAPAQFFGLTTTEGSVATGRRADLVLLDADPLLDIRHTQRIRAVVLDGRLFTRGAIDAMLATAARARKR